MCLVFQLEHQAPGRDHYRYRVPRTLKKLDEDGVKTVHIRINSEGGSVKHMDGIIALMQGSQMEVHTWVDGTAASAAADIFLHCDMNREAVTVCLDGNLWDKARSIATEHLEAAGAPGTPHRPEAYPCACR